MTHTPEFIERERPGFEAWFEEFIESGVSPAMLFVTKEIMREAWLARASTPVEISGNGWVAGRTAFVREADKFNAADRYEIASAIADRAPEKIYEAITAADQLDNSGMGG